MISLPQLRPEANGHQPTPNDIAMAMTGRPHVSWSELRTFQSCPKRWEYQYAQRLKPERVSVALLLGIAVHAGIEQHFNDILSGEPEPTIDRLMSAYDTSWAEQIGQGTPVQYPKEQNAGTVREQARLMLSSFRESPHARPPGDIIGLEESFKIRLNRELPDLAGRVDLITYDPKHHEVLITDYKTSRTAWSKGTAEAQAAQLMLYAEGCKDIADALEATLAIQFIVITKTKQPKIDSIRLELNQARIKATKEIITQVFRAMVSQNIYPVPAPISCAGCGYITRCPASQFAM